MSFAGNLYLAMFNQGFNVLKKWLGSLFRIIIIVGYGTSSFRSRVFTVFTGL